VGFGVGGAADALHALTVRPIVHTANATRIVCSAAGIHRSLREHFQRVNAAARLGVDHRVRA
jgi:hypothetical protein